MDPLDISYQVSVSYDCPILETLYGLNGLKKANCLANKDKVSYLGMKSERKLAFLHSL